MSRKGFTLIELLVVVAVLALLASIVFSNLGGAREGARISNALSFQSQTHSLLGSDLVGWWNFNEGDARDISGYGNDGSVSGVSYTDGVPGTMGSAIDFPGSGSMTVSSSLSPETFTLSFWARYRDYTYPKTFGAVKKSSPNCFQSGGLGWDFGHGFSSSGIDVCIGDGVNRVRTTLIFNLEDRPNELLDKWSFLTLVVNRNESKIIAFVNGKKQDNEINISSVTGSTTNPSNLIFGTLYGWQTDGIIDDVRIYSRVLTAQEIQTLYAQTVSRYASEIE